MENSMRFIPLPPNDVQSSATTLFKANPRDINETFGFSSHSKPHMYDVHYNIRLVLLLNHTHKDAKI